MEDKILIKSNPLSNKTKLFLRRVIIGCLALAILFLLIAFIASLSEYFSYRAEYKEDWYNSTTKNYYYDGEHYNTFQEAFRAYCNSSWWGSSAEDYLNIFTYLGSGRALSEGGTFFIIHWSFLGLAGIIILWAYLISKCKLIITERNVIGKTLFGKTVTIPIYKISAYYTRSFFSVFAVASSSGFIKFYGVANYKKMSNVLYELINKRQSNTEIGLTQVNNVPLAQNYTSNTTVPTQSTNQTVASTSTKMNTPPKSTKEPAQLKSLEALLAYGLITQEEYEAKKKQLFGL